MVGYGNQITQVCSLVCKGAWNICVRTLNAFRHDCCITAIEDAHLTRSCFQAIDIKEYIYIYIYIYIYTYIYIYIYIYIHVIPGPCSWGPHAACLNESKSTHCLPQILSSERRSILTTQTHFKMDFSEFMPSHDCPSPVTAEILKSQCPGIFRIVRADTHNFENVYQSCHTNSILCSQWPGILSI